MQMTKKQQQKNLPSDVWLETGKRLIKKKSLKIIGNFWCNKKHLGGKDLMESNFISTSILKL